MALFAFIAVLVVFIVLANLAAISESQSLHTLFDIGSIIFNSLVIVTGLLIVVAAPLITENAALFELPALNFPAAGWSIAGMGVWGVVVSLRPVRKGIGRFAPIDPASPVHTLALVLVGYLVGNTVLTLALGGLSELEETAVSVTILDVVLQQVAFIAVAFAGVGFMIRRDAKSSLQRLGLVRPSLHQLLFGTIWIFVLVILQGLVGAVWALLDPEQAELLGSLNESLLGNFDTAYEWLLLAIASGFGEEILFRGAIQPVFGIGVTALLFAIVHVQYGLTPITILVFSIGVILGLIRKRYNTTTAIYVHVGYNFVLGLLSLLAVYLEQFINTG